MKKFMGFRNKFGIKLVVFLITLLAFWFASCDQNGNIPGLDLYNITIEATEHGTVTTNLPLPKSTEGIQVTIIVTPDEDYELDTLSVKDADGNVLTVTDNKFMMPASDVTISATFKQKGTGGDDPNTGDDPNKEDNPNTGDDPNKEDDPNHGDDPNKEDDPNTGDDPNKEDDPNAGDDPNKEDDPNTGDDPNKEDNPNHGDDPNKEDDPTHGDDPNKEDDPNHGDDPNKEDDPTHGDDPNKEDDPTHGDDPGIGDDPTHQTKEYNVFFIIDDGSDIKSQTVKEGGKAEMPEEPKKEGYKFAGWFIEEKAFDFDTEITSDIKLLAKWEKVNDDPNTGDDPNHGDDPNKEDDPNHGDNPNPGDESATAAISVTIAKDAAIEVTKTVAADKETITLTAGDGFEDYTWLIDGTAPASSAVSSDGKTLSLKASAIKANAVYQISLSARKNNTIYGTQISVKK